MFVLTTLQQQFIVSVDLANSDWTASKVLVPVGLQKRGGTLWNKHEFGGTIILKWRSLILWAQNPLFNSGTCDGNQATPPEPTLWRSPHCRTDTFNDEWASNATVYRLTTVLLQASRRDIADRTQHKSCRSTHSDHKFQLATYNC